MKKQDIIAQTKRHLSNGWTDKRMRGKSDSIVYMRDIIMQTDDLLLRKAEFEDWEAMYRNVWSRPEAARYMAWRLSASEEDARGRIQKVLQYQENHDTYVVYDKKAGQVIGFAGIEEIEPHIFEDTGIALGPEYVGKGYGKQILQLLLAHCRSLGAKVFFIPRVKKMSQPGLWRCPAVLPGIMQRKRRICALGSLMN